jgi:hypothetical protein
MDDDEDIGFFILFAFTPVVLGVCLWKSSFCYFFNNNQLWKTTNLLIFITLVVTTVIYSTRWIAINSDGTINLSFCLLFWIIVVAGCLIGALADFLTTIVENFFIFLRKRFLGSEPK